MSWASKEVTTISEQRKFGDGKESSMFMVSSEKQQKESVSIWEFLLDVPWEIYMDSRILRTIS